MRKSTFRIFHGFVSFFFVSFYSLLPREYETIKKKKRGCNSMTLSGKVREEKKKGEREN